MIPIHDWCPIRHARRVRTPHTHYRRFVDYGGAEGYRRQLARLRSELQEEADQRDRMRLPQACS